MDWYQKMNVRDWHFRVFNVKLSVRLSLWYQSYSGPAGKESGVAWLNHESCVSNAIIVRTWSNGKMAKGLSSRSREYHG